MQNSRFGGLTLRAIERRRSSPLSLMARPGSPDHQPAVSQFGTGPRQFRSLRARAIIRPPCGDGFRSSILSGDRSVAGWLVWLAEVRADASGEGRGGRSCGCRRCGQGPRRSGYGPRRAAASSRPTCAARRSVPGRLASAKVSERSTGWRPFRSQRSRWPPGPSRARCRCWYVQSRRLSRQRRRVS
jgi:hypothetical protein